MNDKTLREQYLPLFLTVLTFLALCVLLYIFIFLLNLLPTQQKIDLTLRTRDILVGLAIYLKTSIDFAIFIGNLMRTNPGWRKRISIEAGTALGNAGGTLIILLIWNFFREVPLLMAVMISIASLVLLRMAQESIEEFLETQNPNGKIHKTASFLSQQLGVLNMFFKPVLGRLVPNSSITNIKTLSVLNLAVFSFSIPFILGLDDFAGYIPLFSIINVFGFAVGVFLGHMVLNLALFLSPSKTVSVVKQPIILILGGVAFIGIALWGFYETSHIIKLLLHL